MVESRVEPALTPEDWQTLRDNPRLQTTEAVAIWFCDPGSSPEKEIVAVIAALNSRLPDSDPRKIARERVALMREAADALEIEGPVGCGDSLRAFADALASLLPPSA